VIDLYEGVAEIFIDAQCIVVDYVRSFRSYTHAAICSVCGLRHATGLEWQQQCRPPREDWRIIAAAAEEAATIRNRPRFAKRRQQRRDAQKTQNSLAVASALTYRTPLR
jgi:hypothetical protein